MPRTERKATPELAIQLDENPSYFCPGDTIIGGVVRKVHTVSTRAWITVRLHGRSEAKLTEPAGGHYGRSHLFNLNETCQTLLDGPVHIPPGGDPQVWPFGLTIPTRAFLGAAKQGNTQDGSYVFLTEEAIGSSSLPSSFAFDNKSPSLHFHAFVEYYLEAVFRQENDSSPTKATLPIRVRADSTPYPLSTFNLISMVYPTRIKTHRLIAGMESTELSYYQKSQKFFGSSKVPQLSFTVYVESPAILQMQNPIPIPFTIRIGPSREQTTDRIAGVPQTIILTSLTMELKATTLIMCEGNDGPRTASGNKEYNFAPKGTVLGHGPITIPLDSNSESTALDVGAFVGLSLDYQYAKSKGRPLREFGYLYSSFVTNNIRHSHQLSWEFVLEVAREKKKIVGFHRVSILGYSEAKDAC